MATTIGKAITVVGTLQCGEPIAVGGIITGDIVAGNNDVIVEADGRVEGAVSAREITVLGTLKGRLIATDKPATIRMNGEVRKAYLGDELAA